MTASKRADVPMPTDGKTELWGAEWMTPVLCLSPASERSHTECNDKQANGHRLQIVPNEWRPLS